MKSPPDLYQPKTLQWDIYQDDLATYEREHLLFPPLIIVYKMFS